VEAGFDQFTFQGWNGLVGPVGLEEEVITAWNDAVEPILADEEFQAQLRELGLEPAYMGPEEFKNWLQEQFDFATQVVEDLGLAEN
jgi:tripartite-type tricarboxylate transporter receptor subunit TctC